MTTDSTAPSTDEATTSPEGSASEALGGATDELQAATQELARVKDQLFRTAADFDNFRKRSRRELADAERKGRDDLLKDFLPVFDNLERATAHLKNSPDTGEDRSLLEGIDLVIRQFQDTLGRVGIERVQSIGAPFDPSLHEAIQHLETEAHPPGHIAFEVQAGYRQGERLIRPALVVVAKAKAESIVDGPSGLSSDAGTPAAS